MRVITIQYRTKHCSRINTFLGKQNALSTDSNNNINRVLFQKCLVRVYRYSNGAVAASRYDNSNRPRTGIITANVCRSFDCIHYIIYEVDRVWS